MMAEARIIPEFNTASRSFSEIDKMNQPKLKALLV